MNKLDSKAINTIKMLSIDIIKEAKSGSALEPLCVSNIFYSLFANNLRYDINNEKWLNKDKLIVTNSMLPVLYSTLHLFGFDISEDTLKEYKKLNSPLTGYSHPETSFITAGSITRGDVITTSVGISLGERYLENLVQIEKPKSNLVNYQTICVCNIDDLNTPESIEALNYAKNEKLNKLTIICHIDKSVNENYKHIVSTYEKLGFNILNCKNGSNYNNVNDDILEVIDANGVSILFVYTNVIKDYFNEELIVKENSLLSDKDEKKLREKYGILEPFSVDETLKGTLKDNVIKRMGKEITKWKNALKESVKDIKLREIMEFLDTKNLKIDFNSDNLKLNENYNEELIKGNKKIFSLLAGRSPFVLSLSDDFNKSICRITTSHDMNLENPLGRNLSGLDINTLNMIASGLATLGFKIFISTSLINVSSMINSIKYNAMFNLPVHYIFTQDTFLDAYKNYGISPVNELSILRSIPNIINLRPSDINEIIGSYEIISKYNRCTSLIIGSVKMPKLKTTNPKYVIGGAYRVLKESANLNGILIASGEEVNFAINLANELKEFGVDLRVVSMPSQELFDRQSEKYRQTLIPNGIKTFAIEYSHPQSWYKYATGKDYIFGVDKYSKGGMDFELNSFYNLDKDYIKAKIVELMKN